MVWYFRELILVVGNYCNAFKCEMLVNKLCQRMRSLARDKWIFAIAVFDETIARHNTYRCVHVCVWRKTIVVFWGNMLCQSTFALWLLLLWEECLFAFFVMLLRILRGWVTCKWRDRDVTVQNSGAHVCLHYCCTAEGAGSSKRLRMRRCCSDSRSLYEGIMLRLCSDGSCSCMALRMNRICSLVCAPS